MAEYYTEWVALRNIIESIKDSAEEILGDVYEGLAICDEREGVTISDEKTESDIARPSAQMGR